jgi:hypothetical protein
MNNRGTERALRKQEKKTIWACMKNEDHGHLLRGEGAQEMV